MPDPTDLTLGVLFRAREDPNFKRITRRLHTIVTGFQQGMRKVDIASKKAEASIKKMDAASRRAAKGLEATGKKAGFTGKQLGKLQSGMDRLVNSFKVVAVYTIAGRLFSGLTTGLRTGVEEIINFDQALANLKAITGATAGELAAMRDVIGRTAIRTKFSSTEIAEGMVLLGQAGLTAGESIKAVEAVSDLAAGTLSDFKNVTDLVTTSLRAFNIDAGETRRIADVMASAVNKSKLTIDKLRTAFNYVGAGAAQAGLSIERTTHAMMLLANNGMRASTIGTGLRQVLARLLAPNAKLRTAMAEYGLELDKATGEAAWFEDQIEKLTTVMYDFEKGTVDMSKAYQLFGLRGAQAAAILVNSYMKLDGTWERMLKNVNTIGAAQKMMETQAQGLGFAVKNLTDQLKELAIVMGEAGSAGALGSIINGLREATTILIAFAKTGIGQTVVNATILISTLFTLKLAIQAIIFAIGKVGGGVAAFFTGPVGWAIMAVGILAAVIFSVTGKQEGLNRELEKSIAINRGVTASLDNYRIQLNAVKEGSEDYDAVVKRLIQSHPELQAQIERSGRSLEEMVDIIDELERKKLEKIWEDSAERVKILAGSLSLAMKEWEGMEEGRQKFGNNFMTFLEKLPDSERDVEALRQATQGWASDLWKVHENSEDLNKMWADLETILSRVAEGVPKHFATESFDEGSMAIADKITEHNAQYLRDAEMIQFILQLIKKEYDLIAAGALKVQQRHERLRKDSVDVMKRLGWRQFYTDLNALDKFTFMEIWDRTMAGWGKRLKFLEREERKNFKTKEEWAEYTFRMQKLYFDKEINEYYDKEDKKLDKTKSLYLKLRDLEVEILGTGSDQDLHAMKSKYEKMRDEIDTVFDDQVKKKEALGRLWYAFYIEMRHLFAEGYFPGGEVNLGEIEALMAELRTKGGKDQIGGQELPERGSGKTKGEEGRLNQEDWLARDKEIREQAKKYRLENAEEEAKATEEAYRRGEVSAEEYFAKLRTLVVEGGMDYREYQEIVRRETQSTWANLREGWKNFFSKMETNAEFFQRLGEELPEKLSSGFADMWGDFLTGTKDAKEAFSDFARDMLRWLAEMLAKRAMMQALSFLPFHGGGMHGEGGSPRKLKGPMFLPKLHNGLMPNEFPAILKKDEGVFTKKQMAALGMMAQGTNINVPVSVSGNMGERAKRYLPGEIEETVLKVMRKYM